MGQTSAGEPAVVFVEEADGKGLGMLENPEDLLNLMDRLNQNGLREKALYQTLQKRYESISSSLGHRMVHLEVQGAPRCVLHFHTRCCAVLRYPVVHLFGFWIEWTQAAQAWLTRDWPHVLQ